MKDRLGNDITVGSQVLFAHYGGFTKVNIREGMVENMDNKWVMVAWNGRIYPRESNEVVVIPREDHDAC